MKKKTAKTPPMRGGLMNALKEASAGKGGKGGPGKKAC